MDEYSIYQVDIISTIQLNDTGNVCKEIYLNKVDGNIKTQILTTNPIENYRVIIWR